MEHNRNKRRDFVNHWAKWVAELHKIIEFLERPNSSRTLHNRLVLVAINIRDMGTSWRHEESSCEIGWRVVCQQFRKNHLPPFSG
jgi:hypothetical protein